MTSNRKISKKSVGEVEKLLIAIIQYYWIVIEANNDNRRAESSFATQWTFRFWLLSVGHLWPTTCHLRHCGKFTGCRLWCGKFAPHTHTYTMYASKHCNRTAFFYCFLSLNRVLGSLEDSVRFLVWDSEFLKKCHFERKKKDGKEECCWFETPQGRGCERKWNEWKAEKGSEWLSCIFFISFLCGLHKVKKRNERKNINNW